jgi:prepilin-type N-terminal cleavage/methylation domain-containing protein
MIRALRQGFSLLEVMIAAAILLTAITVVVRIQATVITGVSRADKIVVATDLAREKMTEALLLIEAEGLGTGDISARGDFRDFGDDARVDFGRALEAYRWEYHVEEIEFQLNADLFAMMGGDAASGGAPAGPSMGGQGMAEQMMNQMGLGGDQLSNQLSQFVRRVRVRVYWGESRRSEEQGREVVLTTHIISPGGAFRQMGGGAGGAPGGMGPGGMGPGGMGPGGQMGPGGGRGGAGGAGGMNQGGGFGPQGGMPQGGGFRGSIGGGAGGGQR